MNKYELTQEYLKECLDYNLETGVFTWKNRPEHHFYNNSSYKSWHTRFYNNKPGCIRDGYVIIYINKRLYNAHRLAWLYIY